MTDSISVDEILRRRSRHNRIWNNETYSAVAVVAVTVIALLWANFGAGYEDFWHTPASFGIGSFSLDLTLHGFVDEGLMALFFFMVGLDVRRELAVGYLRLLPVAAALGGLIVPVVLFWR